MKTEKLELFANNEVIYKTLIDGSTSRKELADVVSAVYGKKKTASYDIIKELLNDENGMLSVEGDILSLNQDEFDEFMDELLRIYASKSISAKMTRIKEQEDCDLEENPDGCVELNQDNSIKRGFIKTFTESLFRKRVEDTKTYEEMVEKSLSKVNGILLRSVTERRRNISLCQLMNIILLESWFLV